MSRCSRLKLPGNVIGKLDFSIAMKNYHDFHNNEKFCVVDHKHGREIPLNVALHSYTIERTWGQ